MNSIAPIVGKTLKQGNKMETTFLYHKDIKRIEAFDKSIIHIYMKDGSVYSSLFPISFTYDSIGGFFTKMVDLRNNVSNIKTSK